MSRRSKRKLRGSTPSPSGSGSSGTGREAKLFPPEVRPQNRWLSSAVCLLLALAVWAVFGQTLHHEFISYDDNFYVYANPAIIQGLSFHGVVWIFTHFSSPDDWLPLTALSHMVDWQFYGSNAGGHHLTNVLLHAANAILLFLVLQKMTGAPWRSAFVAAVFAIHPLHVESVAWVAERKDVLSGGFFMLTLWAYARFAQKRSKAKGREPSAGGVSSALDPRRWTLDYYLALAFFALGLLSKSMLVTLPFVLLLLDYWPLRRSAIDDLRSVKRHASLLWEKIPFLLLSAAACVVTMLTQKHALLAVQGLTIPWRAGNALAAYADYLWQMLYPVGLAVLYPHPENHLSLWKLGMSVLVLSIISAGIMAGRRTYPCLLVGWLWYLGMLVPVIGFIRVGAQARADRYTYLPQIGLYLLVVWGVVELCGRWRYRRAVLGISAGAILAALMAGAYVQTNYWKDSVTLWEHSLACTSDNSIAQSQFGLALADQGNTTEAIGHYERALRLKPDNIDAQNNLGNALATQGNLTEAIQHYEQALLVNPNDTDAHINLGNVLAMQGKLPEAVQHYERALQLKPDNPECLNNLGVVLATQGKLEEAIPRLQQAVRLATARGDAAYAEAIRARIKYYQPASVQQ